MKRFFRSEAGAFLVWIIASLLIAAALAPGLFRLGHQLAAATASGMYPDVVEWLGKSCGRADLARYFSRGLLLSAALLGPLLVKRIRFIRRGTINISDRLWKIGWKSAFVKAGLGLVIAGGMLWSLGSVLESVGVYVAERDTPSPAALLRKTLIPAISVSLLEEWIFRGLVLGLWLKFSKPLSACIYSSLLFAFLHFLKLPEGVAISNPGAPLAGFELLGRIFLHFAEPQFFVTDFATLFVIGLILAWARVRTGDLWFSIGLHAGWVLAFKGFNLLHDPVSGHPWHPWGVGDDLRSGLFPVITLGLTAAICHQVLKSFEQQSDVTHASPSPRRLS